MRHIGAVHPSFEQQRLGRGKKLEARRQGGGRMGKKFANEDTRLRTRHTLEILGNDDMFESEGKERATLFKQRLDLKNVFGLVFF